MINTKHWMGRKAKVVLLFAQKAIKGLCKRAKALRISSISIHNTGGLKELPRKPV